jgi:hypothetical protein
MKSITVHSSFARLVRLLAVPGLAALLLACNPMARSKDPDSRYYSIPSGSKLILHQDIAYPEGRAHVNIQHGRVVPGLDNWAVGCEIDLRKLGPGVVTADTFTVRRAEVSREWVNRPSTMRFYRTIYLDSAKQSNVIKMVCQTWDYPLHGDDIPMSGIHEALGDVATLEFAQQ